MTLENIRAEIRHLLGDITSSSYSDTNIDRAINKYYHKAVSVALKECGEWEVSGEVSTVSLVANQQEYPLPGDLLNLYKVEANFTGDTGDWVNLEVTNWSSMDTPISNYTDTSSSEFCRVFDNSIFLEYEPTSNVTNGLKIYFSEEVTELSGTSDEPILPEALVSYIINGACSDYSIRISDKENYEIFIGLLLRDEKAVKTHYANKLPAIRTRITGNKENYQ